MKLSSVVLLYRARLRPRAVQELFAVLGIAVGVALLFASQIASTSLDGSVQQLTRGIVGNMRFQLQARGPEGFDERLLGEVQRLPGVRAAAPVLEQHVNVIGQNGSASVDLIGTDPRFAYTSGSLLRHFTATQLEHQQAFALPEPLARSLGLLSLQSVRLQVGARVVQGFLGAELLSSDIGPLIYSPVAVAPLAYAQSLLGLSGRLTRIFVQPYPGREREVQAGLRTLAAGRLNVEPADFDASLFNEAAGPANQSALLFSAISALVGFLFAFNAILLTVPQRRRLVEDLRLDGYRRRAIVEVLLLDALVLGLGASLVGLVGGDLLSRAVFSANPGYLSFAFPVGSQRIVTWQSAVIAVAGGLFASCVGVLAPLREDIFVPLSLERGAARRAPALTYTRIAVGLACVAITTLILLLDPQAAIVGIVTLVIALLLTLPWLLRALVAGADRLGRRFGGPATHLAVIELRSHANRARSLAIAATSAIAVLGSVAIQGAHGDLQRGLDSSAHDVTAVADLWVVPPGESNLLATVPFHANLTGALARVPGVSAVRAYHSGFVDYGARRVWVLAPPSADPAPVPPSQIVQGEVALATARVRSGGWAVVSRAIAREHGLSIGQYFTLPAPHPVTLRVAALGTNIGWPPGALVINAADYVRAWGSPAPSAYNIALAPRASPTRVRGALQRTLGAASGLTVETAGERDRRERTASRQGLSRLSEIALLMLIAAVLATAAATGAMIWQRRPRLADMKVDGIACGTLWRALLIESAVLLAAGCSIGAAFGLYGQLLLSHALAAVTGFPVKFSVGVPVAASSFLLVTAVAVLILSAPGYLAARIRPAIALQD